MSFTEAANARLNSYRPFRTQDLPSQPEFYHLHNDGIIPNTNYFYIGRVYPPLPEMPPDFSYVEKLSEGRHRKWKLLSPLVHLYHWLRGGRRAYKYLECQLLNGLDARNREPIKAGIDHLSAKGRCILARLLAFGIIDHANAQNWLSYIATDKHRAFSMLQLREIDPENSSWLHQIYTDSDMLQSLVLCSKITNSLDEPQRTSAFIRTSPNGPVLNFLEELANSPCPTAAARAIRTLHYLAPEIAEAKTILQHVRLDYLLAGTHTDNALIYQETMSALNILIKRGHTDAITLVVNRAQENDYGAISLLKKLTQEQSSLDAEIELENIAHGRDLKTAANAIAALADLDASRALGNIDPAIFVRAIQGEDLLLAEIAASTLVVLVSQHNLRADQAIKTINPRHIIEIAKRPLPLNTPGASEVKVAAMQITIMLAQGGNPIAKQNLREFIIEGNLAVATMAI